MPTRMYIDAADFISRLDQSGLLSDKIRTRLASAPAFTEAAALAEQLVGLGLLTRYQVDVLLGHRNDPLVLDTYAILEPIGAGGMGRVYRARHLAMDRIVAIKVLPTDITADPRSIERFQREIRAAARLRHPSIVRALDAGEANGVHFLVMEHVDGVPLSALVRERGPLPVGIAVNCIQQAAAALESAHEQGVVHRDVKPSNLMLDRQGMVQVLDMGLALCRAAGSEDPSLTASGAVLGTIDFMAPEQAADPRHADRRADIYSLGCTLFFLLTGRPPYAGGTAMQRLLAHRDAPIPALREARPDVSAALDAVFRRMVAKQPDERYATMADLLAALNACGPWPTSSAAEVSLASTRDFVARPQPAESELSLSTVIRRAAEEATAPGKRRPAHSSTRQNWPWQPWQIGAAAAVALAAVCIGIVVFWRPGGNKANTDKPQTSIPRKADKPSAEPDLTNRRDVAPAAKSPDISRGLLAHWTFDETGDDARDSSGQGRHATINGAKRVKGQTGGALEFDGQDDFVAFPTLGESDAVTFALWIWLDEIPSRHDSQRSHLLLANDRGDFKKQRIDVGVDSDGFLKFFGLGVHDDDGKVYRWSSPLVFRFPLSHEKHWVHVAVVYDLKEGQLWYTNGQLYAKLGADPLQVPLQVGPGLLGIRKQADGALDTLSAFAGRIDDFRVYGRKLSGLEVQQIVGDNPPQLEPVPAENPLVATSVALDRGLLAHWTFDEAEGDVAADTSGKGHVARIHGARRTEGCLGRALEFDGKNSFVEFPRIGRVQSLSCSLWISPASLPSDQDPNFIRASVLSNDVAMPYIEGLDLFVSTSTGPGILGRTGQDWYHSWRLTSDYKLTTSHVDKWLHIVAAYDFHGQVVAWFIDGTLVSGRREATQRFVEVGPGSLGNEVTSARQVVPNRGFHGRIDDVRLYDRALNESEVRKLASAPMELADAAKPPIDQGLLAHWKFDEPEGNLVKDVSGHESHAVLAGADRIAGLSGGAVQLSEMGDRIEFPRLGQSEALSYSLWIKPDIAPHADRERTVYGFLSNDPAGSDLRTIDLETSSGGWLRFRGSNWSDPQEYRFGWIHAKNWVHVTSVVDPRADVRRHYVNGDLVISWPAIPVKPPYTIGPGCLGAIRGPDGNPIGDCTLRGAIDEVRIYNRSLFEHEIQELTWLGEVGRGEPAPPEELRRGLLAHWTFDAESGQTAKDHSGRGHDATIVGAKRVPGRLGGALEFSGPGDLVSFDRLGESDAVTYAMLVRFAIPPPSRQSFALIAHRGFPPASTRLVDVFVAEGWLKFVGRKEDGRGWFDPQEFHFGWVYANRWTHVASVYDAKGNRRSHYVNGRPVYSETNDLHFSRVEIGPACIGNHTNQDGKPIGDVALQGLVDDVRIYERALTEPEIRTLANSRFE